MNVQCSRVDCSFGAKRLCKRTETEGKITIFFGKKKKKMK